VCDIHPEKVRGMWAYQAMMIAEARRCGAGWLIYDTAFRQQVISYNATDFSRIISRYNVTMFLADGGTTCVLPDHT